MSFERHFKTQKSAENYFGHTWQWIAKHKKVTIKFQSGVRTGYVIRNKD